MVQAEFFLNNGTLGALTTAVWSKSQNVHKQSPVR